ncbi:MAG: GHKL domain-containing protein [Bacilli bacterium]
MNFIFGILLIILQNIIVVRFICICCNYHSHSKKFILILFLSIESFLFNFDISFSIIAPIIAIITCIIFIHLVSKNKLIKIIYITVLCFMVMYIVNFLFMTILYILVGDIDTLSIGAYRIYTLLVQIIYFLLLDGFKYAISLSKIDTIIWLKILSLPIFTTIILILCFYFIVFILHEYMSFILIVIISFAINLITYDLFKDLTLTNDKLIETKTRLLVDKYQSIHFQNINQIFDKNIKLKHDFDNHLLIINKLIENHEINESKKYLNDLINKTRNKTIIHSDNKTLNYIINTKLENYVGDLRFCYQTDLKPLTDFEIVTIFSNLISNAIEAQESIHNPYISISIYKKANYLYIKVVNKFTPLNTKTVNRTKLPKTNKFNKTIHGFGLKNIKEILENHNGEIDFEIFDDLFIIICKLKL